MSYIKDRSHLQSGAFADWSDINLQVGASLYQDILFMSWFLGGPNEAARSEEYKSLTSIHVQRNMVWTQQWSAEYAMLWLD